jgi:predicted aldo/keto reductase-like oxidoreductase
MQYRQFGSTGFSISALGFGGMRLPMLTNAEKKTIDIEASREVIHRAFSLGVNYIDTAWFYSYNQSEIAVGAALKGWRDKVRLSTKMPFEQVKKPGDARRVLDKQLEKLDVDTIDFYHLHGLNIQRWETTARECKVLDDLDAARSEGLIRHLSFSSHDTPHNIIRLIDTGEFVSVLCQYNLLNRINEPAIEHASRKGMGVVVMGPVGGGRLGAPSRAIQKMLPGRTCSTPEIALRFVLANPHVSCALSGMNTVAMVEQNAAVASRTDHLSDQERTRIEQSLAEKRALADLYCTGCNYCMPCPHGVNIPLNFRAMNFHRVYDLLDHARFEYNLIGDPWHEGKKAEECAGCGVCEPKCPQNIEIRKQLRETAALLGGAPGAKKGT